MPDQKKHRYVNDYHGGTIDQHSGAQIGIDYIHHEIHDGEMYIVTVASTAIASGAAISICASSLAIGQEAHFTMSGTCTKLATIDLVEDPDISGGSSATIYNMNRTGDAAPFHALTGATVSSGVVIDRGMIPAGGRFGGGAGLGTRPGLEFITDPTKTYAVVLTNRSASAAAGSIVVNFYV